MLSFLNSPFYLGSYNKFSVDRLENFIIHCRQLIEHQDCFWLSLQANSVNDISCKTAEFKFAYSSMLQRMDSLYGFYKPFLHFNMRNTSNICRMAREVSVKYEEGFKKITGYAPPGYLPLIKLSLIHI